MAHTDRQIMKLALKFWQLAQICKSRASFDQETWGLYTCLDWEGNLKLQQWEWESVAWENLLIAQAMVQLGPGWPWQSVSAASAPMGPCPGPRLDAASLAGGWTETPLSTCSAPNLVGQTLAKTAPNAIGCPLQQLMSLLLRLAFNSKTVLAAQPLRNGSTMTV